MVEEYICQHSEADLSHGICDECLHKLYPDYIESVKKEKSPDCGGE
jgi:hypothetical protein